MEWESTAERVNTGRQNIPSRDGQTLTSDRAGMTRVAGEPRQNLMTTGVFSRLRSIQKYAGFIGLQGQFTALRFKYKKKREEESMNVRTIRYNSGSRGRNTPFNRYGNECQQPDCSEYAGPCTNNNVRGTAAQSPI